MFGIESSWVAFLDSLGWLSAKLQRKSTSPVPESVLAAEEDKVVAAIGVVDIKEEKTEGKMANMLATFGHRWGSRERRRRYRKHLHMPEEVRPLRLRLHCPML